jgi:hypothetical protein
MNELAKAVLVFVLSAAAAVWLMGVALHLWPNTDQLAYGNPLPYLKVRMDSGAVRFWVEDFGGLPYERVWLYVNGRLAASGGPGAEAAARCGDEVAAVVKYHSGVKKLEGRILCTQPIKAPDSRRIVNSHLEIRTVLAAQDVTGNVDVAGLPVDIVGECRVALDSDYYFAVHIIPRTPDVLICDVSGCSSRKTYATGHVYQVKVLYSGSIDVIKTAGAPLTQYAGGGRIRLNLYVHYVPYHGWYVYMNSTTLAYCPRIAYSYSVTDTRTWTEYKEANASAIYQLYLQWPDGAGTKATVAIYENKDGTYGFRVISSGTRQPPPQGTIKLHTRYGSVDTAVDPITMLDALNLNLKFLEYLSSDPQARTLFVEALRYPSIVEHNIPMINVTHTETVAYHAVIYPTVYDQSGRVLFIQVPYSFSLGAVLATTVLPVNITKPPTNVTTLSGGTAYVFSK